MKVMEPINLVMEAFILVISKMVNLMEKVHLTIMFTNQMTLNIIKVHGKTVCLMAQVKHIIITEIFIKEISQMDKDKVMDHMYSIKFINMKVNGKIILFMEKENYLEMVNCFLKDNFKMV